MRPLALRLARIFVLALLSALALAWAHGRGMGWIGWALVAALLVGGLLFGLYRARQGARGRREARWEKALFDASQRPRAIAELRVALRRLSALGSRARSEHARLSILLAELLDASGECAQAAAVVDALPLSQLSVLDAALVRHTQAVTHLRAEDASGALASLAGRIESGERELDQRLSLLEVYARLELGEREQALRRADELEKAPDVDSSVVLEARVVRAAALDALGRREEALVTLAALGRESLVPLAELGQPRVRSLAKIALEGLDDARAPTSLSAP